MSNNLYQFLGNIYPAANGENFGIYVVGCIPEKQDLIVLSVVGGKIKYNEQPRRLDAWKASYKYKLEHNQNKVKMKNPLIPMTIATWIIFILTYTIAEFKPWGLVVWAIWLTIATLSPIIYWWKYRKPKKHINKNCRRLIQK